MTNKKNIRVGLLGFVIAWTFVKAFVTPPIKQSEIAITIVLLIVIAVIELNDDSPY